MRSPRFVQRTTRLLTFWPPKPTPIVVFLIDTSHTKSLSSSPFGISKSTESVPFTSPRWTLKTPSSVLNADVTTCAYGRGAVLPPWRPPPRPAAGSPAGSCAGGVVGGSCVILSAEATTTSVAAQASDRDIKRNFEPTIGRNLR